MRSFAPLALFFVIFAAFPAPAQAAGFWHKLKCAIILCEGSGDEAFTRPELEDGKIPHNSQYENDTWVPQDWIDAKGSATAVVDGFYQAGIIHDQSSDWRSGQPEIEVGQGFMHLSGQDKRRVMAFMDHTYKSTERYGGTIFITHAASGDSIGIYNQDRGLQLQ